MSRLAARDGGASRPHPAFWPRSAPRIATPSTTAPATSETAPAAAFPERLPTAAPTRDRQSPPSSLTSQREPGRTRVNVSLYRAALRASSAPVAIAVRGDWPTTRRPTTRARRPRRAGLGRECPRTRLARAGAVVFL